MGTRERRHSERIRVIATKAFCQSPLGADWYDVGNISEGGVLLENGFSLPIQTKVTIDCMRFEGKRGRMIGEVVRNKDGIGIRFDVVNDRSIAFLEDIKSKELLTRSGPVALALVEEQYAINWFDSINSDTDVFVVRAESYEDAKSKIEDPWIPLSTVIIDNSVSGKKIATFLSAERPELTTFLVTRSQIDMADASVIESSDVWVELKSPGFKDSVVKKMSKSALTHYAGFSKSPPRRRRENARSNTQENCS